MSPPLQRVLVVGSSCAGKSTFARALSDATGLPCVELDQLFWGLQWTAKPAAEFRASVDSASAAPAPAFLRQLPSTPLTFPSIDIT